MNAGQSYTARTFRGGLTFSTNTCLRGEHSDTRTERFNSRIAYVRRNALPYGTESLFRDIPLELASACIDKGKQSLQPTLQPSELEPSN